jgi:hypothetical protein
MGRGLAVSCAPPAHAARTCPFQIRTNAVMKAAILCPGGTESSGEPHWSPAASACAFVEERPDW